MFIYNCVCPVCCMHAYVLLVVCTCPVVFVCMSCCMHVYVLLVVCTCPVVFVRMSCCMHAYVLLVVCTCPVVPVRMCCCIHAHVLFLSCFSPPTVVSRKRHHITFPEFDFGVHIRLLVTTSHSRRTEVIPISNSVRIR